METRQYLSDFELLKYDRKAKNPWCIKYPESVKREVNAVARLFCFHHAGASAASFREWSTLIIPDVQVIAIELPGHQTRSGEPFIEDVVEAAKKIVDDGIMSLLDRPFFMFGHSFGASIAFEVVRYLESSYNIAPIMLFVSGCKGPEQRTPDDPPSWLKNNKDFVDFLMEKYQDPNLMKIVKEYPDLLEMAIPVMKADIKANDLYKFERSKKLLQTPIKVFCGEQEPISDLELNNWKDQTTEKDQFAIKKFPGGHFYQSNPRELINYLNPILKGFTDLLE
eukprot:TRINITY_DN6561_c0_g1_i1.p1 TRINITY_DN6561_c0_g1~~TRINITY_DN6561_c0_g1_i1.p1  ORF type:complete len:280 (-),score=69.45 TRINITY_DN6561_c0_g1_i1:41-880(-)